MPKLQKNAIDIGIITNQLDAMLGFYRDDLGLAVEAVIDMPGGGIMHRLKAGDSVVKIIETDPRPELEAAPGGIRGATGYRYWTLHVSDLEQELARLKSAGHDIMVGPKQVRPGVTIAMVADPDGNWVELLQNADGA
ncbi:MAG: VOC family protein [Pseudomonadales bacterium]|nr:VOC family protein [Pseudomonadales bacterium]